jgi:hypothetical protein
MMCPPWLYFPSNTNADSKKEDEQEVPTASDCTPIITSFVYYSSDILMSSKFGINQCLNTGRGSIVISDSESTTRICAQPVFPI